MIDDRERLQLKDIKTWLEDSNKAALLDQEIAHIECMLDYALTSIEKSLPELDSEYNVLRDKLN